MKGITYLTAAALAVGAWGLVGCKDDEPIKTEPTVTTQPVADGVEDDVRDAGAKVGDAARDAGNAAGNAVENMTDGDGTIAPRGDAAAPDAEGIRDVLAQVAEAALTKDGLEDVVERFPDPDRNRIKDNKNSAELNGIIDQFRKDWNAKYSEDFDIKDEEAAYPASTFAIVQSENADGRNTATVTIAESHGMPAVTVPMVHEAPDMWRVDVPDTLDTMGLAKAVQDTLSKLDQGKDTWPTDKNEAYAAVTHALLAALQGK